MGYIWEMLELGVLTDHYYRMPSHAHMLVHLLVLTYLLLNPLILSCTTYLAVVCRNISVKFHLREIKFIVTCVVWRQTNFSIRSINCTKQEVGYFGLYIFDQNQMFKYWFYRIHQIIRKFDQHDDKMSMIQDSMLSNHLTLCYMNTSVD